jgi:cobalt-zinc-cadmium efflux system outer membrane protein
LRYFQIAAAVLLSLAARADVVDWQDAESVVRAADAVSPTLASIKNQISAARHHVISAGSLPNPMLMAGVQNQQVDLSIDRQMTMYTVGASQTLTRKSRREAERGKAELEVVRLQNEFESKQAEVEREVLLAYYEAGAAQSEFEATSDLATVAGDAVSAARARYEAGSAPQTDMIRSLLEQKQIEHQVLALTSRRNQAVAKLAALLHVAPNEIPKFTLAHGEHEPAMFETAINPASPAVAALQAVVDAAEDDIRLAQLALKPDINVEASYGLRPYQKDTISVVGRIELPYRRKTLIEPRVQEAIARRDAARQEIEVLQQRLQQDLGVAVAQREEAVAQIQLHESALVPAAKMAFESALSSYQTGKETFESVLTSLRAYNALRVDYFDFLEQQLRAEADITALRKGARAGAATAAPTMETR